MDERKRQIEEHFHAARALPPGEARERLLKEAGKGDPRLQMELEALLAAAEAGDAADVFHTKPGEDAEGVTRRMDAFSGRMAGLADKPGSRIGPYKLLQEIGEGGFGVVWMAEQTEPVSRRVALKVIKPGMDTREVIARFEAERQAIAMMDHPNIARVFEAGATASGRPFFAMELVKGVPINKFCDEQRLDTRRRVELFTEVCAAVNHAHQKGVIHRDLKPSNILVTLHGDRAVPKIIDFGIAKATHQPLTDKTLFTRFEQFIGTPAYMSPEQASVSGLDIDTRSDVYSLGVLLYELITGKPPFDTKSLLAAGYEEMRRIIREQEPPKPSTRLSTVQGDERTAMTRTHHADPERIGRLVRGDLDWIVMKAIEKDRTRRYETADAFAKDIRRFLANEPVEAAAPSNAYRLRKFVRRHHRLMAGSAAAALVLVAATAVSLWQAALARRAQQDSARARSMAESVLQETNETLVAEFRSVGKLEPLAKVAGMAVRYFAGLPPELRTVTSQRLHAAALENLAAVLYDRREVQNAAERWAEAIRLRREILQAVPGERRHTRELAEALISQSEVLRKLERYQIAAQSVREAEQLLTAQSEPEKLTAEDLESLARARHGSAIVLREQAGNDADPERLAAIAQFMVAAELLAARPDATVRGRMLISHARIEKGDYFAKTEPEQAAALYAEAAAGLEKLNAAEPDNAKVRESLGIAYDRQGDAHLSAKSLREAGSAYSRYAKTMQALTRQDPTNIKWQRELFVAITECGDVQLELGHADIATTAYEEALTMRRRLAAIDANNADALYDLTSGINRTARAAAKAGNASRTAKLYAESRQIAAAQLAGGKGGDRWRTRQLGSLYGEVQAMLQRKAAGDVATALKLAEQGLALAKEREADPAHTPDESFSPARFEKLIDAVRAAGQANSASEPPTPTPAPTSDQ